VSKKFGGKHVARERETRDISTRPEKGKLWERMGDRRRKFGTGRHVPVKKGKKNRCQKMSKKRKPFKREGGGKIGRENGGGIVAYERICNTEENRSPPLTHKKKGGGEREMERKKEERMVPE